MKYFTSELLVRLQDRSNAQNFVAALDDWERALTQYKKRLRRVRGELPNDFRLLLEGLPLHDFRVLDMWWGGRTRFTITLQPESWTPVQLAEAVAGQRPQVARPLQPENYTPRLMVLTYSLTEPPMVQENVLPESVRSQPIAWLYDELDVRTRKSKPQFAHHILLSDGREVQLHFRNVAVNRPLSVVPAHA